MFSRPGSALHTEGRFAPCSGGVQDTRPELVDAACGWQSDGVKTWARGPEDPRQMDMRRGPALAQPHHSGLCCKLLICNSSTHEFHANFVPVTGGLKYDKAYPSLILRARDKPHASFLQYSACSSRRLNTASS